MWVYLMQQMRESKISVNDISELLELKPETIARKLCGLRPFFACELDKIYKAYGFCLTVDLQTLYRLTKA